AERAVGLRARGVDDLVIVRPQVVYREVLAQRHVAEEAKARLLGGLGVAAGDGLDVLMIGCDAAADQPVGRGEPVEHIHGDRDVLLLEQGLCRIKTGRTGTDNSDPKRCLGRSYVGHSSDALAMKRSASTVRTTSARVKSVLYGKGSIQCQQSLDDIDGGNAVGFGVEAGDDAVPKDGNGHLPHVFDEGRQASVERSKGFGSEDQILRGARPG